MHSHATIPFFPMQPDPVVLAKSYDLLRGLGDTVDYGFAEHTFDIVQGGIRGTFNVDQGDGFNHIGYELAAKKNGTISKGKKVKKEVHIMEDNELEEGGGIAYGYVKASSAISLEGTYEATEGLVALPDLIENLKSIRKHVEIEHKIDIIVALKGALNDVEGCSKVLRDLKEECPEAGELMQDLLLSVVEARQANMGELDFNLYLEYKGL